MPAKAIDFVRIHRNFSFEIVRIRAFVRNRIAPHLKKIVRILVFRVFVRNNANSYEIRKKTITPEYCQNMIRGIHKVG